MANALALALEDWKKGLENELEAELAPEDEKPLGPNRLLCEMESENDILFPPMSVEKEFPPPIVMP